VSNASPSAQFDRHRQLGAQAVVDVCLDLRWRLVDRGEAEASGHVCQVCGNLEDSQSFADAMTGSDA